MNKLNRTFFVLVLIFCAVMAFAQNGSRVNESTGNFSYCPPLNWNVTEFPGLKYKIVFGPTEGNFAANINFVDETYNGNLRDYVDTNLSQLQIYFQEYRLISRNSFRTNSGILGECVVVNNVQNGFHLKQTFYFLQVPNNRYFVVTCSVVDTFSAKYSSVFEDSIKTFEIIK